MTALLSFLVNLGVMRTVLLEYPDRQIRRVRSLRAGKVLVLGGGSSFICEASSLSLFLDYSKYYVLYRDINYSKLFGIGCPLIFGMC